MDLRFDNKNKDLWLKDKDIILLNIMILFLK